MPGNVNTAANHHDGTGFGMNEETQDLTTGDREVLAHLGHPSVPELLTELLAPARRGRDLAVLAGTGSGKEALYALTAADRCRPDSGDVQALILSPTRESAARASRFGYELAGPEGIHALAWSPEFSRGEAAERPVAQLVAGRPDEIMEEIRAGRLGIEGLRLLVLDGVSALAETDPGGAAEEILDTAGEETQIIAVSDRADDVFTRIAGRRLDRPRRWPRELLEEGEAPALQEPGLGWGAAPGFEDRVDLLARGLQDAVSDEPVEILVHCGDEAAARRVAAALSTRGLHIASEPGEPGVGVAWGEEEAPEGGVAAWFGLPSGLPGLRRTAAAAARRLAVVRPEETAQLHLLARRAGWAPEPIPGRTPRDALRSVDRYRAGLRDRMGRADAALELLVLEPLVEAHGFPDLTAALSAWLRELLAGREGESATPSPVPQQGGREESAPSGRPSGGRGEVRGGARRGPDRKKTPAPPWTRLFVPVGERDGVRPGDLVGAITGETDAVGGQIGKIEIRDSYSLVDVESGIAEDVIRDLSGATIRGRRVEVRRDRES